MSADPDVCLFSLTPEERNKFTAWLHSRPERAGFETGARLTVRREDGPDLLLIVDSIVPDGPFSFTLDVHSVAPAPRVPVAEDGADASVMCRCLVRGCRHELVPAQAEAPSP